MNISTAESVVRSARVPTVNYSRAKGELELGKREVFWKGKSLLRVRGSTDREPID